MNSENAKAQMRKGLLEYCILSLLSNGAAYSTELIQKLRNADLIVVEGTIYPLLNRLKNGGLLQYRWEESTQGPPRKYYELTQDGSAYLSELDTVWQNMVKSINALRKLNK